MKKHFSTTMTGIPKDSKAKFSIRFACEWDVLANFAGNEWESSPLVRYASRQTFAEAVSDYLLNEFFGRLENMVDTGSVLKLDFDNQAELEACWQEFRGRVQAKEAAEKAAKRAQLERELAALK